MAVYKGLKFRLVTRFGEVGLGMYSLVGCLLTVALVGLTATVVRQPMLAPSLGPTVLLFFESPLQPAACTRNAFIGHVIGIAAGWFSLAVFGLLNTPPALSIGINVNYAGAAAVAVALTAFAKHLAKAPHPPAGATTLIVALGLLRTPIQIGALAAGIVFVTVAAWCINRLLGVPMPMWRATS